MYRTYDWPPQFYCLDICACARFTTPTYAERILNLPVHERKVRIKFMKNADFIFEDSTVHCHTKRCSNFKHGELFT